MLIGKRDFTYMRTRFNYDNYEFNNKKYKKVLGGLSYSVKDNHPFNKPKTNAFVGANLERSGYVLHIDPDSNDNETKFHVLSLDPSANILQWVVNQFAPSKGMGVKKF